MRWLAVGARAEACHSLVFLLLEARAHARTALRGRLAAHRPDLSEGDVALFSGLDGHLRRHWFACRCKERIKVQHECVDFGALRGSRDEGERGIEVELTGRDVFQVEVLQEIGCARHRLGRDDVDDSFRIDILRHDRQIKACRV